MSSIPERVAEVQAWFAKRGTKKNRDGMGRYGIVARNVYGVSLANVRLMAKRIGRDHTLALALWRTDWYEPRMLAAFIDEPDRVTSAQMDRWVKDFDNWAITDCLCFHLFDKTPLAWQKIREWAPRKEEFVRRAAFALLASVALHDKKAPDEPFVKSLKLVERYATDDRNFVKKGVSWALRGIGKRNPRLKKEAIAVARRLAGSDDAAARWVGKDALRDLMR